MNRAVAALLVLAACGAAPPPETPGPLLPSEDGFDVGGTDLEIGFGRSQAGAIAAATKLIGRPPAQQVTISTCDRAVWADGLTMYFMGGAFVGWSDPLARTGRRSAGTAC